MGRTARTRAPADARAQVVVAAAQVEVHMHLDADRDGTVDTSREGLDQWEWGHGRKGAVIMANTDDDSARHDTDLTDNVVNGGNDTTEIAPLVFRRAGPSPTPAGWSAHLTVDHPDKIRIFERRAAGATQVIGPGTPTYTFPNLDFTGGERELGMEATAYPDVSFDGLITLTLMVTAPGGATTTETAVVRVAPWVTFHHLQRTTELYVWNGAGNAAFRSDLRAAVPAAIPIREATEAVYGDDRWLQDAMEVGFSALPATPRVTVLRTANDRAAMHWGSIDTYPRRELLGADYGWVQAQPPTASGSSLDSFGNLECSPPVTVNGRQFKFGRIIYGASSSRPMQQGVRDFLSAQRVQSPFSIFTDWLTVGHVDEMLSFCPAHGTAKGFKLLLASGRKAVDILREVQSEGHGSAEIFTGKTDAELLDGLNDSSGAPPMIPATNPIHRTVDSILADQDFVTFNTSHVETHMRNAMQTLMHELGLTSDDIYRIPTLFFARASGKASAYLPDTVNMLVVTSARGDADLCIPKPFGPVVNGVDRFERFIQHQLGPGGLGNRVHFIDDFDTYHAKDGEIHCGTNSKREPPTDRWWWEQRVS